jgi:16S rRNA (adenine1518-N6/adenine1519-N6)-dimethyltransferase
LRPIARKRFGQHFLTDPSVIDAIVDAVSPKPGQPVLEIGPGRGAITLPMLARCGHLTAIELDRDLVVALRRHAGLTVIEGDVLKIDLAALAPPPPQRLRVVGNLPYNISTPILFHLLDSAERIEDQHFMLQKEVVQRIAAEPCSKDYGRLSVMLQWRYQVEPLFDVPPQAFEPPPRVHSAVLRMLPWPAGAAFDAALLSELVAVAFSQRRKLLRHTLGRWLSGRGFAGSFDLQRRAEEVPVAQYVALASALG